MAEKQAEADAALQDITASMQVIFIVHSVIFLHSLLLLWTVTFVNNSGDIRVSGLLLLHDITARSLPKIKALVIC